MGSTSITFAPQFHIDVHGNFRVEGTVDSKAKLGMTSQPDNAFTAFGITVYDDCEYFTLDYTTLDYGTLEFRYNSGNSNLVHRWIDHCVFNNNGIGLNDQVNTNALVDIRFMNNTVWSDATSPVQLTFSHDYPIIQNNIIMNTEVTINCQIGAGGFTYNVLDNSTVTNYTPDPNMNLFTSPFLTDPNNGDYSLQSGSPCIDAGNPNSPLDPDGTRSDIGAYYYPQLNGDITQDITLSGEVAFQSNVTVAGTATMTLEPGTRVFVNPAASIQVNGSLDVNGTAANPVVFDESTANDPWYGIVVNGGTLNMDYATVKDFAGPGINVCNSGTGWVKNSHLTLGGTGIMLNRADQSFMIKDNEIDNLHYGIVSFSTNGMVSGNLIHDNDYWGLLLVSDANPLVGFNQVYSNGSNMTDFDGGITILGSSPSLSMMVLTDMLGNYPVNNVVYGNNPTGVYIGINSNPDLGSYSKIHGKTLGGFNRFYGNTLFDLNSANDTVQYYAQVNYWYSDIHNPDYPAACSLDVIYLFDPTA
jgi:parallel beta-helix repeat protein